MKRGVTVAVLVWITRRVVNGARRYFDFAPMPCAPVPTLGCEDCAWEPERPMEQCPASQKTCGHHCECSWIFDECCWCKKQFGENGEDAGVEWMGFDKQVPQ